MPKFDQAELDAAAARRMAGAFRAHPGVRVPVLNGAHPAPAAAQALCAGEAGARLLLLGGETLNGPRHIWWNFVASSRELIEAAKADWAARDHGRFALPPGDGAEFIPLP